MTINPNISLVVDEHFRQFTYFQKSSRENIGHFRVKPKSKYYVEFEVEDGRE